MSDTNIETGCIIDGSHWSAQDFTIAVIRYAISKGFEIDQELFDRDVDALENDRVDSDDELHDILDGLDTTFLQAVDYIADLLPEGYYYIIDENGLYLEEGY